jgi:hypothetical protein
MPPRKLEVMKNLEETKEVWETIKEESIRTLAELEKNHEDEYDDHRRTQCEANRYTYRLKSEIR